MLRGMALVSALAHLTALLHALAVRAGGGKPDLTPAVGVIGGLGELVLVAPADKVRQLQATVATVRDQLRYGSTQTPAEALSSGQDSHVFLAGALWAVDEFMEARLDVLGRQSEGAVGTARGAARAIVLDALGVHGTVTPGDVLAFAEERKLDLRADQVSRALGDLLAEGVVEPSEAPQGADRRRRFFRLATTGADVDRLHGDQARAAKKVATAGTTT